MKKINDEITKAFEKCLQAVSLGELSKRTGVGKKTLRRFVARNGKYAPSDTLRQIYPEIRRYILLKEAEVDEVRPVRIGNTPRMGHYLDDLNSDEKVLIDTFSSLRKDDRRAFTASFADAVRKEDVVLTEIKELSAEENNILSLFRAIKSEYREEFLMSVVECAVEEMKKRRKEF
jgi:hypothetical protein